MKTFHFLIVCLLQAFAAVIFLKHTNVDLQNYGSNTANERLALRGTAINTRLTVDGNTNNTTLTFQATKPTDSIADTAAICAIQKGSLTFIDEWVDYNLAIGFEKIYIYDNSEDFELQSWYEKQDQTRVDVKHFPGQVKQVPAYHDCITRIKWEDPKGPMHKWLAFIDLDEFIVLKQHENILELLEDKAEGQDVGGLALNWYMFGYDNQIKYKPIPMTKRFQTRDKGINQHVKVILRTDLIGKGGSFRNSHAYKYNKASIATVDTTGKRLEEDPWFNIDGPSDVAVIHHYHTKSLEEYVSRCARGRADMRQRSDKEAACRSEEEILEGWERELQHGVLDISAWETLKHKLPKYEKYDDLE